MILSKAGDIDANGLANEPGYCPLCGPNALRRTVAASPDFEYRSSGDFEWTFRQCLVCDTLHLDPRPAPEALKIVYPSNYYAFSMGASRSLGYRVKARLDERAARTYLKYYPGAGLICDVGAGDGRLVEILQRTKLVPPDRIYGIEPGLSAVQAARARNINIIEASMESADWAPNSHGLLILQQVIEHVRDPRASIMQAAEALAPGGVLILETPNARGLDARLFGRRYWGGFHTPRHFFLFNPNSLQALAATAGLELVAYQALPSPNFWIQSVHHWATERTGVHAHVLQKICRPHPPGALPLAIFTSLDLVSAVLFRSTSNMRIILKKGHPPC